MQGVYGINCQKCDNYIQTSENDDYFPDDFDDDRYFVDNAILAYCDKCKSQHILCNDCNKPMKIVGHYGYFDFEYGNKSSGIHCFCFWLTNIKSDIIPLYMHNNYTVCNYIIKGDEEDYIYNIGKDIFYYNKNDVQFKPEPKILFPELSILLCDDIIYKIYDYIGIKIRLTGPDGGLTHGWKCDNKDCEKYDELDYFTDK